MANNSTITRDGSTQPSVATSEPGIPAIRIPTKDAALIAMGPGVILSLVPLTIYQGGIALAARSAPVRVMFPMVTHPEEVVWARGVLDEVLFEMGPVELPVGIMVEVPAAALRASDFSGLIDFASIGTNDLAQYALASDRTNAAVGALAPMDDPAVWDLIELTCRGLPRIPVAVCGDLASDPDMTAALIERGVTELSVRPPMIGLIKQAVRQY